MRRLGPLDECGIIAPMSCRWTLLWVGRVVICEESLGGGSVSGELFSFRFFDFVDLT